MVKYTFHPGSIEGLEDIVELKAHNYVHAENKVKKWLFLNQTHRHRPREKVPDCWDYYKD